MPIYDFRCKECGYEFESLVLKNSGPPTCPSCSSLSVDRIVSMFSCTTVNLDKRLQMESEDKMRKGQEWMKKQKLRKSRIKIL